MALTFKSVGKAISSPVKGAVNLVGGLFRGQQGPANPFAAPQIDFLRTPMNVDRTGIDRSFQDYVGKINAPSSVDAVRAGLNQQQLDLMMGDIERDTRQKFGTDLSSYFGRGLIEPGVGASSDIASVGLAQTAASGARTAANARLGYQLADVERLAAREKAVRDAYAQNYDLAGQLAIGDADRQTQRDIAYATGGANLYNAGEARKQAGKKNSVFEDIVRNVGIGFSF